PAGRAVGLLRQFGLVEVAPADEVTFQKAAGPLELTRRLAVRALGAGDVGTHRGGGGLPRLEPRARLVDGRLRGLHADDRRLQRGARLVDLRARALARQPPLGACGAE